MTAKLKNRKQVWGLIVVLVIFMSAPVVFAQPAVTATVTETGKDTISLDFKDAEIGTVLRVLSMKSNVNIVAGPEVKGLVTVRLDDVPWQKALEVILRTYNYVYERDGNIIRVTTRDQMAEEPVETKTFILDYSKAEEMQVAIVDILSDRGRVKVSERTNMLVVTDIPTKLYQIGEIIKKLDQVTPQAYIDSKIVRTDAGQADNLGIQWNPQISAGGAARPTTFPFLTGQDGREKIQNDIQQFFPIVTGGATSAVNPADARTFPLISSQATTSPAFTYGTLDFSQFTATLRMLESFSNTKIVSNPRIVVLNNQTAMVNVGTQVPIASYERNEQTGSMQVTGFDYRDTGVLLNVTPHINSAEEILVELKPEVSSEGASFNLGGGIIAPRFDITQADTQVLIQSGQTIAIGGLMTDSTAMTEDKVPYLANIPLVGKFFRSKRQTAGDANSKIETLFFVTVTMVDSEGQPAGKRVKEKEQKRASKGSAQAMDKSAAGSNTTSQSEAPKAEGTSPEKP